MTATEALDRAQKTPGGWTLDLPDGSIEFRSSSFPGGPDCEREGGQRFGTSYVWVRFVARDGQASRWARSGSRSLVGGLIDAIKRESAVEFFDSLCNEAG